MWLLLSLSYDGFDFYGWAKQKQQPLTIQNQLEQAFQQLTNQAVGWSLGASKTDRYVHALDQRVLLQINHTITNLAAFQKGLNRILAPSLHVNWLESTTNDYNIRANQMKTYCYTINDQNQGLVFTNRYTRIYPHKIVDQQLATILQIFVGKHNFFYFSGIKANEQINPVRIINQINLTRTKEANYLQIRIIGPSFIRYQIRMIIENALQCYEHKLKLEFCQAMLTSPIGTTRYCAPGWGLCLEKIVHNENEELLRSISK